MKIAIKTLGCKSNRADTDELISKISEEFGENASVVDINNSNDCLDDFGVDVCLVNTCTVTHVADRKSRASASHFKKLYPEAKICVFGCGPKVDKKGYEKLNRIDFVATSVDEVLKFLKSVFKALPKEKSTVLFPRNPDGIRTRAVVKVQDGCNNFCSYCIIPFARGREKSRPMNEVLDEVNTRCKEGYKEIVLTGINIGNWREKAGNDNKKSSDRKIDDDSNNKTNDSDNNSELDLGDLTINILDKTPIERVRLSSIEPQNFSKSFEKLLSDPKYSTRFCPHLHMSLQSGSDDVLKAMRRHYDTKLYKEVAQKLRILAPDIALTTDVIVGFPGETEKNFKETFEFVKSIGFSKVHVFPYSKRTGTVASLLPNQVPEDIKKTRSKKLQKLSDDLRKEFFESQIGKIYPVLIEHQRLKNEREGLTPNYIQIKITSSENLQNQILNVKLIELKDGFIKGKFV